MFALPGIIILVLFIYARPHEFIDSLASVPILYYALGLAGFGALVDVRLRRSRVTATPQLKWALAFYAWCALTLFIQAPAKANKLLQLAVAIALYLVVAHAVQSFKGFQVVASVLLGLGLFVAGVCVDQGFSDYGCIRYADESDRATGSFDGRGCETGLDCETGDAEPGMNYICERVGSFGTSSIAHGRVRYRGVLQDPNEVSLAVSIVVPFVFAMRERKPSLLRTVLLVVTMAIVGTCVVMTQSRGGQLVLVTVLAAYFVKKYGFRGLAAGGVLALPLLLLGGRNDADASSSSEERLECWYEAVQMVKQSPVIGVGYDQFTEHHFLTAHNSFLLAVAELGLPGVFIFSAILYLSMKIPIVALRRYANTEEAAVAKTWSMAILAMLAGMIVGAFFLSFTYHFILWIHVGLAGALFAAIKSHDKDFDVSLGWRDLIVVGGIDFTLLFLLSVYTRLKV